MYDSSKYSNEVYHRGLVLPQSTVEVHGLATYAMAVPLVVLVLGLVLRRKDMPITIITSIAWCFALCWPLFGILVWQFAITVLCARRPSRAAGY